MNELRKVQEVLKLHEEARSAFLELPASTQAEITSLMQDYQDNHDSGMASILGLREWIEGGRM